MTYAVEFNNVSRLYGDVRAVDGVTIAIRDGEFFSMLGPSGSGKTTCLRLIAGFEQLSGGTISIFGKEASELPPWERDVNTVFQDYALFPHMSILDNVAYGLMVKGVDKKKRHAQARDALEKVGLSFAIARKPSQLSGGQRQRAWIAMVLAQETSIMLLDEPTTWLDISHQIDLLELLSELNRTQGYTLAAVLHDLNQACRYATHLIALRDGEIVAQGTPKEIVTPELIARIYGMRCMIIDDPVAGTPLVVPLGRR